MVGKGVEKNLVIWIIIIGIIAFVALIISLFAIVRDTESTPRFSPRPDPVAHICSECNVNPDHVNDGINECIDAHGGVASSESYNNCADYSECQGGCGVIITCEDGNIQSIGGDCDLLEEGPSLQR
jgi:hypothetical protein